MTRCRPGTVPVRGGPGSATHRFAYARAASHPGQQGSPQIQFLEEVVALVVDHDEGREIFYLDPPDRLHAELGVFHGLDLLDAMLREVRRRAANGGEIEAAVLPAGLAH